MENIAAKYFVYLKQQDEANGQSFSLSNLKLQKLLYFLQMYHYEQHGQLFFKDDVFEAWRYGPVIPKVYNEFKSFGANDIFLIQTPDLSTLSEQQRESIRNIWHFLRNKTASQLVTASHKEGGPWHIVYNDKKTPLKKIDNKLIEAEVNSLERS